jgi:hypothetical protein
MNYLDLLQSFNNTLYNIMGDKCVLSFKLQVWINGKRFEKNLVDMNEVISNDEELLLVQ